MSIRSLAFVLMLCCTSSAALAAPTPAPSPSPLQQLFLFKEIVPDLQRIGVVWTKSSQDHDELMKKLNRASTATSVEVVVAYAEAVSDVASAYRSLTRQHGVEAIWVLEEAGAMTDALSRSYLVKNTLENNLPLLAPSEEWVSEGAALSMHTAGGKIQLIANKSVCSAMSLIIPEKYTQQTQYLARN